MLIMLLVIQKVISLIQKIMGIPVNMTYKDGDGDDEAWSLRLQNLTFFSDAVFFGYCQSNVKSFDIIKL